MANGYCLYGSKKKPDAPPSFTVDTGVACFLFGVENYLCRYLDLIVAKGGGSVKGFIKALIKRLIGQILEDDIQTQPFCEFGVPALPEDINYFDVFGCFVGTGCDALLEKITAFYHYAKWFQFCECIPNPPPSPYPSPNPDIPFDPNGDPVFPPPNPIPPGDCFEYFTRVSAFFLRAGTDSLRDLRASSAWCRSNGGAWTVTVTKFPPPPYTVWENLIPPYGEWGVFDPTIPNPCDCRVQRHHYYMVTDECSGSPTLPNGGWYGNLSGRIFAPYLRYGQFGCDDTAGDGGQGGSQPPPEEDFYPDFPWLRPRKKRKGGASCGCCGSQWSKDKNVLYLPSRYKI